jgi:ADP-heptose:LPS heptosyltransferase
MRVLIVKTSSMGDVLHTLPALTDAAQAFPAFALTGWLKKASRRSRPGMKRSTG